MGTDTMELRRGVLADLGATGTQLDELLAYNANPFDHGGLDGAVLPLAPEPHLAVWEEYAALARQRRAFEVLAERFAQLRFPVREGISLTPAYQAATRSGALTTGLPEATGLELAQPAGLRLAIHSSLAGRIPVLIAGCRQDFVLLVQALTHRNEPKPVGPAMGACMIGGFNNWDRIRRLRSNWEAQNPGDLGWALTWRSLQPQKHLYQDRFILLSDGEYSGVGAEVMGLPIDRWLALSLSIRLEHECMHYFTRRVLGSMRNNLLDELIADYAGLVLATGGFRADWFLRFMGLEGYPLYRQEGRLQTYRGEPPLSEGAWILLQDLLVRAARNLEAIDRARTVAVSTPAQLGPYLVALTCLTLEELAFPGASSTFQRALEATRRWFAPPARLENLPPSHRVGSHAVGTGRVDRTHPDY